MRDHQAGRVTRMNAGSSTQGKCKVRGSVPHRESGKYGDLYGGQALLHDREGVGSIRMLCVPWGVLLAFFQMPDAYRAYVSKSATGDQLGEHAIDSIWAFTDLFQYDDASRERGHRGGAHQVTENA